MSKTKHMDFKERERGFYAIVSSEGAKIGWQIQHYTSITPKTNFKHFSVFANKDEKPFLTGTS